MKTVAFHNLGCKVNSYELDIMQQILTGKGYKVVPFDKKADIYVINTCTVTNIADRKSRQMLHRAKQLNPDAIVVAVGCYVQTDLEGVEKDPGIDLAIGNNRKKDIAQILEEYLRIHEGERASCGQPESGESAYEQSESGKSAYEQSKTGETARGEKADSDLQVNPKRDKTLGGKTVLDIAHIRDYEEMTLTKTAEHTRAYIKIQDGCNQFCSYCAIPLARGRVRSRLPQDILHEIEGMVKTGYQEVVLTGIHISSYGIDFGGELAQTLPEIRENAKENPVSDYRGKSKLMELIALIHEVPGLERIRISSLEPRIVTKENAERLAGFSKVCPHFHLSLQSGCDATLKRMNRHYSTEEFEKSVQALREAYAPEIPAITTDVIVGFPGETEEEFHATKAFLEKIRFYEMHVFKYSKRAGTRAAVMPDQIPERVKAQRSDELLKLEREQSVAFRSRYIGRTAEVLFEESKEIDGRKYLLGHTKDYVRVAVGMADQLGGPTDKKDGHVNQIVKVHVEKFLTEEILQGYEIDLL